MRIGRTLPPAASPIYPRDILSGIKGVFRGKKELERFQSELKKYFNVKHCFLVSSGKAALTLILQALKELYPERDEVLIPAFTCYSVPSSIVRAGLKIRLCDISPDTLDFNFDQLSKILSQYSHAKASRKPNELSANSYELPSLNTQPETRNPTNPINSNNRLLAIIPTHLFGLPANIDRLRQLIDDAKVTIIEDAAQTMGSEWKGKRLGTLGDVSFFSLGRGKALSAVEGGIILTDRDDIAEKIRSQLAVISSYNIVTLMRLFFMGISLTLFLHPALFWLPKSLPFLKLGETIYDPDFKIRKMSAFQAGLANGWQKKLEEFKKIRSTNSKHLSSLIQQLSNYQLSAIPAPCSAKPASLGSYELGMSVVPSLIRFPVRVDNEELRKTILMKSNQMGLGIMPTYPNSIDGIQELRDNFQGLDFPMAKKIAHQLITLPIHPFLSRSDKRRIAKLNLRIKP
jgi:dTDP-4-amino-4,6-dideoxygalactose transaminase